MFWKRHFLDPEDEDWHLQTWGFLVANFGGLARLKRSPLVTASRNFFPPTEATGHERAEHIFASVKKLSGMSDWPCRLEAQPDRPPERLAEFALLKPIGGQLPLGTFRASEGEITISYDPASVSEPATLVATLVHELAHYLLSSRRREIPGGEAMHEFATDLTTVFLGFGLFGANRAFNFSQHGDAYAQGWRSSRQGYLRERDWALALAVFLSLRDEETESLKGLLKPHLFTDMKTAARYLRKNPGLIDKVREANPAT